MPDAFTNERWIVFGDSLSDNGLFHDLTSAFLTYEVPFQTDLTDYSQSFTNGSVYADTWMGLSGVEGASYLNLALGGADANGVSLIGDYITEYSGLTAQNGDVFSIVTEQHPVITDPVSPYFGAALDKWDINLLGQVDRYLEYFDDDPDAYTAASISIGANDLAKFEFNIFDYLLFGQVDEFAVEVADAIESGARRLADDGVDRIILNTLPVAQLFYAWDNANSLERHVGEDLIETTNLAIHATGSRLQADGIKTEVIRIDYLSHDLNYDPASFGFGTAEPVILGYGGDPVWVESDAESGVYEPKFAINPSAGGWRIDQRLFYDEIHPSAALHGVLGIFSHESTTSQVTLGNAGANVQRTGSGTDLVLAHDGDDDVKLRGGDDVALGGRGADRIAGNKGSDLLMGGGDGDTLIGGRGADLLAGGPGTDALRGAGGGDILIGGTDDDFIAGGRGNDQFIFVESALTAADDMDGGVIVGGRGNDKLWLVLSGETLLALGTDASAEDLAALGLTVRGVEQFEVLDYAALDALTFDDHLGARFEEAQLWGVV
jgi:phospholipase/lecithinase/hemolysin